MVILAESLALLRFHVHTLFLVAILTFLQPEIEGWAGFMANEAAQAVPKMNLYLPSDHESLPWTGAFTGLMILHFFYWGNNQYLVQRALAAKSLRGCLKTLN